MVEGGYRPLPQNVKILRDRCLMTDNLP